MKEKILIIVAVVMVVLVPLATWGIVELSTFKGKETMSLWSYLDKDDIDKTVKVEKGEGDYKILNLTDVQFSDGLDVFGKDKNVYQTIDKLVEQTQPDLITITGDIVWTKFYRHSVKTFINYMESLNIKWAPVLGNHDGEGNGDRLWLAEQFSKAKNCLFVNGPSNLSGVGNYIINIMENGKIAHSLYMMDSHSSGKWLGYDYIKMDQMAWYMWGVNGANEYNGDKIVNNSLFFHIALPEFADAYKYWEESGFDSAIGFGSKNEDVCASKHNSGFFDIIKSTNSTQNIIVGHDHVNDFSVNYEGIQMTYGVKTGDRCYNDKKINGGTLISVNSEKTVTTHIYITD